MAYLKRPHIFDIHKLGSFVIITQIQLRGSAGDPVVMSTSLSDPLTAKNIGIMFSDRENNFSNALRKF